MEQSELIHKNHLTNCPRTKNQNLTILLVIIVFAIANSLMIEDCRCQWVVQNSGITANLYDVKFTNRYTGWACGENGILLKTTNSGNDWINVPNPTTGMGKILNKITLVDANVFYFVGAHSTYIKTTNGGANWIIIRNGPWGSSMGFTSVFFLNKDTGWACGNQRILRTTNGGLIFDSTGLNWGSLSDVYFKDFNNGLICGDGVVFKSTDGGMNWINTNVPTGGHYYPFAKLAVRNNQYVWIAGGSSPVYHSSNFGSTWDSIGAINSYPPSVMYCVSFSSMLTGFAGGTYGYLYKTIDGGHTWNKQNTGTDQRFWGAMHCHNDSVVWGVGGAGKIMFTTTGGTTYIQYLNTETPSQFKLYQNYPNPFNPSTNISYDIPKDVFVTIKIYDISGREIKILVNEYIRAGRYIIGFNASGLSSGIYFCKIIAGNYIETKRMVLIK